MKYVTTIERMAEERARVEEKQTIALNMFRKQLDLETIAEVTGLTITQLQALKVENQ
jgi:hypothetical protein